MKSSKQDSAKKKSELNFKTRALHQGRDPEQQKGFVNPPVYHGSTVVFPTLKDLKWAADNKYTLNSITYGRRGNPTCIALENTLADLENGYAGLVFSSGMAAITTALTACLKSGDHLLITDSVYSITREFCNDVLTDFGVLVSYYDPMLGLEIEQLIQDNTRCIFLESPGTSTFEVQDTPTIVEVANKKGITTIMDNTWASPCFFKPLDHGINISVASATKYVVGHSDAMLGAIVTDEKHYPALRRTKDIIGHCAGPDDAYLGLRGIRTLSLRMTQHQQQALQLAHWLKSQPDVHRVLHPALEDCPGHEFWKRDFTGSSGLFSFEIEKRSDKAKAAFLDNLQLFAMGYSWGAYESLILPIETTQSKSDKPLLLIRIHAGLEDIDDLIADLDAGLNRYRQCP